MRLPVIDYDAHPAYRRFAGVATADRVARVRTAHAEARRLIEARFAHRLDRRSRAGDGPGLAAPLGRHGVVPLHLEVASNRALFRYLDELVRQVAESGDASRQAEIDLEHRDGGAGALGEVCIDLIAAFDLVDLAKAQLAAETLYVKASLRHSTPQNQAFQRDTLADHPDPRTVGLHFDVPVNSVKLTLYLSEVGDLDGGAFGYIPGSHRRDPEEVLDRAATHVLCTQDWMRGREDFMALPNRLRQRALFGGDIIPGSPTETRTLAAERVITGSKGRCILFDTLGAHRGGMMRRGSRDVLQIGLFDAAWGRHEVGATP